MTLDPADEPLHWHSLDPEAVAARLDSDCEQGIADAEAHTRLVRFGPNALPEARQRSPAVIFAAQFADVMIVVLIAAAILAGFVGEARDSIVIAVIVVLNGVVGFVQEYRAQQAMAALRRLASPSARVIRGGARVRVDARDLVPGDLVELEAGDIVPADLRLAEVKAFAVDESALTGESQPVDKVVSRLPESRVLPAERVNLAFKGTVVTRGRGRGLVVATGVRTELGTIAGLLEGELGRTPLQQRLARFGRHLAFLVLAICAIIFAAGWLRGEPPMLMLMTAVSLAVAAIPEALPAVVTIALALGAARMVGQHALIRRLPAVEALGSVTFICADKTGTLTQNRMRVDRVHAGNEWRTALPDASTGAWHALGLGMTLCNDARGGAAGEVSGDPTEVALREAATAAGFDHDQLERDMPRLAEVPFDSTRARMSTLHREGAGVRLLVKGAPEAIIGLCNPRADAAAAAPDRAALIAAAERMAAEGLRVLAFAERKLSIAPETFDPAALERDLAFVGFTGLIDPPRPEAAAAVGACRAAGIVPVMITGDHPATARAIAGRLGIIDRQGSVLTGTELARLSERELTEAVGAVRVYARITPEQKLDIVRALQERGEFVAMTGDGVNDAPALKQADIGVAMGKSGTEVAREAADMVLLDDDFATIVAAVRQGRRIFDNVRKFVRYALTGNSAEIWTIFLAPFMGLPIPLLPIHILWINLVTDGLPGLALANEPAEGNVMTRAPRPPGESLFADGLWQHVLWVGLLMGAVTLVTQAWALEAGAANWQSMVLTVLTFSQLGHVIAIRTERRSLFSAGACNRALAGAVAVTFILQMAVLYVPWLNEVFRTQPLTAPELGACLLLSAIVVVAVELEKLLVRRGWIYRAPDRASAATP